MTNTLELTMFDHIVGKLLRVPRSEGPSGDGSAVARQFDAALLDVGFAPSEALLSHVAGLAPGAALDLCSRTLRAVRTVVGDNVRHNSYFIDFPANVPDTMEFWVSCLRQALVPVGARAGKVGDEELRSIINRPGFNLLDLPTYGRYQHSFADLLAAHDELVRSSGDRLTVLHLGASLAGEEAALFQALAGSRVPLGEADLELFTELASGVAGYLPPREIPVRENRAMLNAVYLRIGSPLVFVDSVVDVLRAAVAASDGDVSLQAPSKLRNFSRPERRRLLAALSAVVASDVNKLSDVGRFSEQFKRLEKALHPRDYRLVYPGALSVFDVARGVVRAPSLAARAEAAFRAGDRLAAARALAVSPGLVARSVDRVLRGASQAELEELLPVVTSALPGVSGRVLLSLREHLYNRTRSDVARVFVGRTKRAWVTPDERPTLDDRLVRELGASIDAELLSRMPNLGNVVFDESVLGAALPLSGKGSEAGFEVLPRGSRSKLPAGDTLRFFVHWVEKVQRTDFDLSLLMLTEDFSFASQVSYTALRRTGVTHSGDLTAAPAPEGASEFIDVKLAQVPARVKYLVPQVNVFSGEGFDEVATSMFGWMVREAEQRGMPFEPRTVRMRSEMRGSGRVSLPLLFVRGEQGWEAVWTHLYLKGHASGFNRVENNRVSSSLLVRSIVERAYLNMGYLATLLAGSSEQVSVWDPAVPLEGPVTFIGRSAPEALPSGSVIFSADRWAELIPG